MVSYILQRTSYFTEPMNNALRFIFRILLVLILFLLEILRFSLNVAYYCLQFNVGNFGLDIFLTQLMFGLTELPAHIICIWLLEALGRKISLMSTLLIGGFLCLLILAVQGKAPEALMLFLWLLSTLRYGY